MGKITNMSLAEYCHRVGFRHGCKGQGEQPLQYSCQRLVQAGHVYDTLVQASAEQE